MYLEKLEINGFKSFAHKVTLQFKPGITAVVGPNGSGKSNVADAMRWVLGEQSIKLLRGKKSEDVIFSGSDKKARLGMAEVSLYFNNEKDEANIGMSEICITRKLYRNGDSEYLINRQKTRLSDISMLLAKVGVAKTSYSIIGQGMIDNFLLASPQERKEFFEEASGVKPLQIKRAQTLNKLEATEENLETATVQLKEITPRLNSLTRQVKRLEQRAEIELKLKDIQGKYFSSVWHEINEEYKEKHAQLKKHVDQQSELQIKVNELQQQMAELTKDNDKSDVSQKLQEEYQQAIDQKMKLSQHMSDLKIKSVQIVRKSAIISAGPNRDDWQKVLKTLKTLKILRQKVQDELEAENWPEVKKILFEQSDVLLDLDAILEKYQEQPKVEELKKEQEEKEKQKGQEEKIKDLEKQIKTFDDQIENIQKQIRQENEKGKEERSQIWQIQQKYQEQQHELNQTTNRVNDLRVEIARLETRRDDLEQDIKADLSETALDEIRPHKTKSISEIEKREYVTEIGKFKNQLELIGGIDPEVQNEYQEIKERHSFLSDQLEDLNQSIKSLEKLILELDETIKKQFDVSFKKINEEFQEHFKTLFAGGKSKLILIKNSNADNAILNVEQQELGTEQEHPLEIEHDKTEVQHIKDRLQANMYAGVEIEATPPGKKLKSISMLSGGERAMTSIALLCAILSANPSPFVVLDEVDAALDESNSIRYSDIVERLSDKSQFIIITHNRATMEKSDILYGVTMGDDGVSTLLSLKLESAEQYTNR